MKQECFTLFWGLIDVTSGPRDSPAFSIRKKVEGEFDKVGGGPAAVAAGRCRAEQRSARGRVREGEPPPSLEGIWPPPEIF